MSRFEVNSIYHNCYSEIIKRAKQTELELEAEDPAIPVILRGLTLRVSLPLLPGIPWLIVGQFQCHDNRYLTITVAGIDRTEDPHILGFTIGLFNVSHIFDDPAAVTRHLDNYKNAALVWEYTHGLIDQDLGQILGLHVHRFVQPQFRYYHAKHPVPMTSDYFGRVLDDAIAAVLDPEAFWNSLSRTPP